MKTLEETKAYFTEITNQMLDENNIRAMHSNPSVVADLMQMRGIILDFIGMATEVSASKYDKNSEEEYTLDVNYGKGKFVIHYGAPDNNRRERKAGVKYLRLTQLTYNEDNNKFLDKIDTFKVDNNLNYICKCKEFEDPKLIIARNLGCIMNGVPTYTYCGPEVRKYTNVPQELTNKTKHFTQERDKVVNTIVKSEQ